MENPALTNQLKALFFISAGLLLAIFLGWIVGTEDYGQLILGVVFVIGASLWFFSGPFFWVLTVASSFLSGTFPILRGAFTPFQILMAMGLAKFVIGDVILRRTRIRKPDKFDLFLIAGFMGILTIHAIHDRFGMRFLGSTVWGGRNYVNVYVGLAAFFVIQSIPMNPKIWAKLPHVILAVSGFDLFIAIFTTIFPGSIYTIYPFYSAVSAASLQEAVGGNYDITGRIGAFGNFGVILTLFVLASTPLRELFHPSRFFRLFAFIAGAFSALYSGYRSSVLGMLIGTLAAGIRDLKWAVLVLLPVVVLILFGLSVVNSEFVQLPKQIQRGLAFIPGNWDAEMARDVAGSNDFRFKVWTLWSRQYFPAHPWLGRGFGFKSEWSQKSIYHRQAVDHRQMVETGNIHNGFFATLDAIGIAGAVFFIIWNLRLLIRTFRVYFDKKDPAGIALRFVALYLGVSIISYWIGASTIGTFLPQEFALAAVFLRLQERVNRVSPSVAPASSQLERARPRRAATT